MRPKIDLSDLDRNHRPVGRAYKGLIERWQDVVPAQSACLIVPVVLSDEYSLSPASEGWIRRFKERRAEEA